ncbi:serine/arginine repetitive matrix protein 1 [Actinomyces sp. ZJ308]|uniref:serine/arginine repetitive matrix protein 1 n=1 Tax=Actinomyces sp. ZJ308 TaxID=2708342 RepID=UPI0014227FBA|nr:serine/arginine repetitive matrix protein 1 [Actinomyces sp. ZJ308]
MPLYSPSHRNHAGRSSHTTRCLALGLCLTAGLTLSACGPAHKGQLTVEPVRASAGSSDDSSQTPSAKPSPSTSATPSASASATAWSAPSVTITSEDTSVWTHDDGRIKKDSAGPNGTIDGYTVNDNAACFGFISSEAEERYYTLRGVGDDVQSQAALRSQQTIFSGYQTTQGPTAIEAVRDDNGTFPGYEETFSVTANFADAPNTPMDGYRFDRRVGDAGFEMEVMLLCPQGSLIGLDQWHTILSGIRLQGIDAGPM